MQRKDVYESESDDDEVPPPPPPPHLQLLAQTRYMNTVTQFLETDDQKSLASTSQFLHDWHDAATQEGVNKETRTSGGQKYEVETDEESITSSERNTPISLYMAPNDNSVAGGKPVLVIGRSSHVRFDSVSSNNSDMQEISLESFENNGQTSCSNLLRKHETHIDFFPTALDGGICEEETPFDEMISPLSTAPLFPEIPAKVIQSSSVAGDVGLQSETRTSPNKDDEREEVVTDVLQRFTDVTLFEAPLMLTSYMHRLIGRVRGTLTDDGEIKKKKKEKDNIDAVVLSGFKSYGRQRGEGEEEMSIEDLIFSGFTRGLSDKIRDVKKKEELDEDDMEQLIMSSLLKGKVIHDNRAQTTLKNTNKVDDQWPIKIGNKYYSHDEAMEMWTRAKKRSGDEAPVSAVDPSELKDVVLAEIMAERLMEYKKNNSSNWNSSRPKSCGDDDYTKPAGVNSTSLEFKKNNSTNWANFRGNLTDVHIQPNVDKADVYSNPPIANTASSAVKNCNKESDEVVSLDELITRCQNQQNGLKCDDESTEVVVNVKRQEILQMPQSKGSLKMFNEKVQSKNVVVNRGSSETSRFQLGAISERTSQARNLPQKKNLLNDSNTNRDNKKTPVNAVKDEAEQLVPSDGMSCLGTSYGVEVPSMHGTNCKLIKGGKKEYESVLGSQFGTEVLLKPEKVVTARRPRTLASHNMNVKGKPKLSLKTSSFSGVVANVRGSTLKKEKVKAPPVSEVKVKTPKTNLALKTKLGIKKTSKA